MLKAIMAGRNVRIMDGDKIAGTFNNEETFVAAMAGSDKLVASLEKFKKTADKPLESPPPPETE